MDATTAAKVFAFSFESLKICSSFQATKHPSRFLTRLAYLTMDCSRVSYSPFTYPTTSCESLHMMRFYEDTDFARSTLAKITSYSVSLLDEGKPSRMACLIFSLVGALSCKPTPAPVW